MTNVELFQALLDGKKIEQKDPSGIVRIIRMSNDGTIWKLGTNDQASIDTAYFDYSLHEEPKYQVLYKHSIGSYETTTKLFSSKKDFETVYDERQIFIKLLKPEDL